MSKFQIEMANGKKYVFAEIKERESDEKIYITIDVIDDFLNTYPHLSRHVFTDSGSFIKEIHQIMDRHEFDEIYQRKKKQDVK